MKKQPDFNKLWEDHFGTVPRKVVYKVRHDCNGSHDFIFLSSLLHDARIIPERVKLRGKQLTIPLERDCWEAYSGGEFFYCQSVLSVSPVQSVEWRFMHPVFRDSEEKLWVSHLEIGSGELTPWTLRIDCTSWKCLVSIDSHTSRITLRDKTMPKSHSQPL